MAKKGRIREQAPPKDELDLDRAIRLIQEKGGTIRTSEAIRLGIHAMTLYRLRDQGRVESVSRGVYRLADLPSLTNPDLVTVTKRVPKGVICLISALAYHGLTTQIPRQVCLALPRGSMKPRLNYPPLRIFWYSEKSMNEGVETHSIDGVVVSIFSAERSLADVFKYRNKIGFDVALEALKAWQRTNGRLGDLLRFARVCRVEEVMRPYLEATA